MGKFSRDKGKAFERWVASELRSVFPNAKRGFQTRGGTQEEPDVKGCGPFVIECKAHQKVNRAAAFKQACEAVKDANVDVPLAICKDDRQKPVVRMRVRDLHWLNAGHSNLEVEFSFEEFKALCFDKWGKDEQ